MDLADLDYPLPPELIAQEPAPERTAARLLVMPRDAEDTIHAHVADLPRLLRSGDLLVLNDARVMPARVRGRKASGGRIDLLVVRPSGVGEWDVLVRGTPRAGECVHFAEGAGTWVCPIGDGRWRLRLEVPEPVLGWLERVGEVPLPPYIRRPDGPTSADRERYQTTFARTAGAVAAPTAGLHFTPELLAALATAGVAHTMITLYVGPGTFLPIRTGSLATFAMESEPYDLPADAVAAISETRRREGRVIAVGTTTTRALESSAAAGSLCPGPGDASLFIRPGHVFRVVDALLTNFHLPRSPLLALVAAFGGWERVRAAYAEATRARYRFYSYGDAMLVT